MLDETDAIVVHRLGGPEVLGLERVPVPAPGPGEVLLRQTHVGVNFADIYRRSGQFESEVASLPFIPGVQASGEVLMAGPGADLRPGERVAYVGLAGAYAAHRVIPAARAVRLPDDVGSDIAAALLLRGLTAEYLLRRLFRVEAGQTILVHAAAGGVGLLLCQWAKSLGATVIGTVGTDEKAALARANGCDHPVVYTRDDFVARVRALTGNRGVPVVYDSVGRTTFKGSLACLAPRGMAINYGTASGQVEPFPLQDLHARSLIVTRPTLRSWVATREELETASDAVFALLRAGTLSLPVVDEVPLSQAAEAHRRLEGRGVLGALILRPNA